MKRKDTIEGVILTSLSAFLIKESFKLHNNQEWALSPALFPLLITVFLFLFSIFLIIKGIKNEETKYGDKIDWRLIFYVLVWSFIYAFLLPIVHFIPATILYLSIFLLVLGEKKWSHIIFISILTPVLVYYLFNNLFNVFLP